MKKKIIFAAVAAMMMGAMAGCGSSNAETTAASEAEATTVADAENSEDTSAAESGETSSADNGFVNFGGNDYKIGDDWNAVKDNLGSESKPSETIEPCDGGDYIQIMHYYDGLCVTTLRDEKIISLSQEGEATDSILIMGKVKIGDSVDSAKEAIGEPDSSDEYQLNYSKGSSDVMVYIENNAVSGFNIMERPGS